MAQNAFILGANSELELAAAGDAGVLRALRSFTGTLLVVFGSSDRPRISTPLARVGVPGIGVYVEAEEDRTYVCPCNGEVRLQAVANPSSSEVLCRGNHDAPRYVFADGGEDGLIRLAPCKNHSDEELTLLQALVGRATLFGRSAKRAGPY